MSDLCKFAIVAYFLLVFIRFIYSFNKSLANAKRPCDCSVVNLRPKR